MKSIRMIADSSFVITGCFLVTLAVAALTINVWGWNSGNVAAWVQAVGSIAAIVGAYIVGERQAKATLHATQEAHQLAKRTRRDGMFSVVKAARSRAKEFGEALDDPYPPSRMYDVYHPSIIDSLVELLNKVPVHELGSEQAIGAFVIFSGQFTFLKKAMAEYLAGPYGSEETKKQIAELEQLQYDRKYVNDVVDSKRQALRRNVQVHLTRIEVEYLDFLAAFSKGA